MNRYTRHLIVIPEDDANRQIATGFVVNDRVNSRQIKFASPAGGWSHVRDLFFGEYVPYLRRWQTAHVVMLIDFDGHADRREKEFDAKIPEDIKPRVFVFGVIEEPEATRKKLGMPFSEMGSRLADDCKGGRDPIWDHQDLRHNKTERDRFLTIARDILFISQ